MGFLAPEVYYDYLCSMKSPVEIMSPVGSFESLSAAIQAGAGSVYFGIGKLNMRSGSSVNFSLEDLREIVGICERESGKRKAESGKRKAEGRNWIKTYLTLNAVVFDHELDEVREIVDVAKEVGVTAIIASDISVIQYCRQTGMEVHLSTQCNITNIEAVRYYAQFADVIVLARELNLDQVTSICHTIEEQQIKGPSGGLIRIEIFIHGALCMAVSGKCYLSLDNYNTSGNRGECIQPCRRGYLVTDKENGMELEIDNEYIMSPKDLCTIGFLDKILDAGVSVLKIEGRGRSPEYVKTVTRCYHEAVEAIAAGTYSPERTAHWEEQLKRIYNRGFWDGYYLGRRLGEWASVHGSVATKRKVFIGKVTNYYPKITVAEMKVETHSLHEGDDLLIIGPTTGVYEGRVQELRLDAGPVAEALKGDICSFPVTELVRRNDKCYRLVDSSDPLVL